MKNNKNQCRLYVVRHGETLRNVEDRVQGHTDTVLSKKGLMQAKVAAAQLKEIPFTALFSSDLLRAKKTAEIIAMEHGLVVATSAALRERNFGSIEGKTWKQAEGVLGEKLFAYRAMTGHQRFIHRLEDGMETDEEIVTRFLNFLREVAVGFSGEEVLVVCHGGLMRTTLIHLGFGTPKQLRQGAVSNLGYFVLESDGVEFQVVETQGITLK